MRLRVLFRLSRMMWENVRDDPEAMAQLYRTLSDDDLIAAVRGVWYENKQTMEIFFVVPEEAE